MGSELLSGEVGQSFDTKAWAWLRFVSSTEIPAENLWLATDVRPVPAWSWGWWPQNWASVTPNVWFFMTNQTLLWKNRSPSDSLRNFGGLFLGHCAGTEERKASTWVSCFPLLWGEQRGHPSGSFSPKCSATPPRTALPALVPALLSSSGHTRGLSHPS